MQATREVRTASSQSPLLKVKVTLGSMVPSFATEAFKWSQFKWSSGRNLTGERVLNVFDVRM